MKKTLVICCFTLLAAANAYANSWGNDRSDVWWDPSESGWGAYITQQQDTIVMALYVFGDNNLPTWYIAALKYDSASVLYKGDLVTATGPSFADAFNPNLVTRTVVGTAILGATDEAHMDLTYTVNGKTVRKVIQRMTWAPNALSGTYYGGLIGTASNCYQSNLNGYMTLVSDMTITHNGASLVISGSFANNRGGTGYCTFSATFSQSGRMGTADGSYTCSTGEFGKFSLSRLEATANGILAGASSTSNVCAFNGRFGAIKKN